MHIQYALTYTQTIYMCIYIYGFFRLLLGFIRLDHQRKFAHQEILKHIYVYSWKDTRILKTLENHLERTYRDRFPQVAYRFTEGTSRVTTTKTMMRDGIHINRPQWPNPYKVRDDSHYFNAI
jgi:hypothetical protein